MKFLVKDNAENQYLFAQDCQRVISAYSVDEVISALQKVESLQNEGFYLAGWISYEASPAFDSRHKVLASQNDFPLVYFMAAKSVEKIGLDDLKEFQKNFTVENISHHINQEEYEEACSRVLNYIKEGDIYQANFSFRCEFPLTVDPLELFVTVEQQHPVPHSFYMDTGEWQVLSHSPELFLSRNGDVLESHPMKGTVKRAADFDNDEWLRYELTQDAKSRAENVMIVDLMRNDMSRICKLNTVKVPTLFEATRYASLHQLTSIVKGEAEEGTGLVDILNATFPAGSITGAPKIRSMEIISELEKGGRGLYTGSAGIFKPGGDFSLNVCIRTIVAQSQKAIMGIGSGVVADSAKTLEWEECLLKSSFLNFRKKHSEIFETMLWSEGEILYLEDHLQRLKRSCLYFSEVFPEKQIVALLNEQEFTDDKNYRLRLSVGARGKLDLAVLPIEKGWQKEYLKVVVSEFELNSKNPYLYHKTDSRSLYNEEFKRCLEAGFDEVLFFNERQELCEGAISNIFLKKDGQWSTPILSSGLLPGTWRKNKIQELATEEKVLSMDDLKGADEILLGNSVRLGGQVAEISVFHHDGQKANLLWRK
ncbi:MAG: aminodeoxychorismate synthase component I [Lentisphaerales bacterium]|nr:aminodeoxychorismate synthase component I [Lentisphaerales bacterium]